MKTKIISFLILILISSCSLAPGMHMSMNDKSIYVDSIDAEFDIKDLSFAQNADNTSKAYVIGSGDQVAITVWGLPEIFPIANMVPEQNFRRVDFSGNIYFPYVGEIKASGLTQKELREKLTNKLSNYFNDPQIDLTIARFNSQKIYLLGEVTRPSKIFITDIPLTLSDALGEVMGLNTTTSSGSQVFIIRNAENPKNAEIYRADMSSPSSFIVANQFILQDDDIIYVNAKSTTRFNRVISQFFPFSSFLASVDNLAQSD